MNSRTFKSSYSAVTLFCLLLGLLGLVACGDAPTPTRVVPGTGPTIQSALSNSAVEVAGASEVQLDRAFSTEVSRLLPGAKNLYVRLYVSAESADKLASSFDTAITNKGYSGLSGKPTKSGDTYVGIYNKTGADDLILTTLDAPKDASGLSQGLNFQGLSESTLTKLYNQIQGKKGIALVFSGTDLVKAVFDAAKETTPTSITPQVEITAPPATTTPVSTGITNGPGSELLKTLVATREVDLKVTKVERFDELNYEGKAIKAKGVFLVISYDFVNLSKSPVAHTSLTLKDNQGREFENTVDYEISSALDNLGYKSSYIVNPGFIGSEYKVYDVPKEATSFQLVPFFETERKPSIASFSNSGGKGSDSAAGAELAGKTLTIAEDKTDIKVTSVERYSAIKDGSKSYKSDGVYLIVSYEMKNNGSKPVTVPLFYLQDSEGRTFSSSDNFDVILAVAKNSKTRYDDVVNPGQSGVNYKVFEVLKGSSGFNLIELS